MGGVTTTTDVTITTTKLSLKHTKENHRRNTLKLANEQL